MAPRRRARWQLAFAAAAVMLAAADTYVVVVALPAVMAGVGLGLDQLGRATPILSGFLLGYVAVLPLLGRLSDRVGRTPVFVGCLIAFAAGSLLTATAHALSVVVAGRALQGIGGGGLVPVTLSLVAARWAPEQRGLPLGVVGAVQELGSVIGPLYGAAVLAVGTWRAIFWLNIPLAAVVGSAFVLSGRAGDPARVPATGDPAGDGDAAGAGAAGDAVGADAARGAAGAFKLGSGRTGSAQRRPDVVGPALATTGAGVLALALWAPMSLVGSVTWGGWWAPFAAGPAWAGLATPVAAVGVAVLAATVAWEAVAPRLGVRPLVRLAHLPAVAGGVDLPGAALLAGVLGCVVVVFSTADPRRQLVASSTPVLAPLGVLLLVAFVIRQRRAPDPLLAPGLLRPRAAWGSLVVNLTLGAALVAALIDVPFFARATRYPTSQVGAALILTRLLVAVPVGAVLGGLLVRRGRHAVVTAAGAGLAAVAFAAMVTWSASALSSPLVVGGVSLGVGAADVELVVAGLGFGLAIAPVNAAMLDAVPSAEHGLASALLVVARTVGMLAGLSALTAIGVRRFFQAQASIGSPLVLCPGSPGNCPAYQARALDALLAELHTIFGGAALCAAVAAVVAVVVLRRPAAPVAAVRRHDAPALA